ncbi:uncharacterized protein LOC115633647 [Scaptodrosophila lebanonensis]|uniref:Uncharacterized protein LOC115633647 n=1 Tax=Drosophila lebanonensis TaxID=7225 RepID=A0A6J2UHK8_DROLE|nr:uncharacterized protein LOC115633647 [Scaptodrosophila lebanonensis]
MVRRKSMLSGLGLANQLSLSAYQYQHFLTHPRQRTTSSAWFNATTSRSFGSNAPRSPLGPRTAQVHCLPSMPEYWHSMCNKLVGAMPRMAAPPMPETPSKKLTRLRRQLMKQRSPTATSGADNQNINYAQTQYKLNGWPQWCRPYIELPKDYSIGLGPASLEKMRAGESKIFTNSRHTLTSSKTCHSLTSTPASQGRTQFHSMPSQQQSPQKPQPQQQKLKQCSSNISNLNYKPFNFGLCANSLIEFRDGGDGSSDSGEMNVVPPKAQAEKTPEQQQQQEKQKLCKQYGFQGPIPTNFSPVSILKKRSCTNIQEAFRYKDYEFGGSSSKGKREHLEGPQVISILRHAEQYSQAKDMSTTKLENEFPKRLSSKSSILTTKSKPDAARENRKRIPSQSQSIGLIKDELNRASAASGLKTQPSQSSLGEQIKKKDKTREEVDIDALRRILQPLSKEVKMKLMPEKSASKQRKLNLSELRKENKVQGIEKSPLWDSIMQLVVHMCADDVENGPKEQPPQTNASGHGTRLSAGSGANVERRTKQYSVYLLVTSDEEEDDDEEQKELRNRSDHEHTKKDVNERQTLLKDQRTRDFTNNIKGSISSHAATMETKNKKYTRRRVARSQTNVLSSSTPLQIRPPLHWPKTDFSKTSKSKLSNVRPTSYVSCKGQKRRAIDSNLASCFSLNRACSNLLTPELSRRSYTHTPTRSTMMSHSVSRH